MDFLGEFFKQVSMTITKEMTVDDLQKESCFELLIFQITSAKKLHLVLNVKPVITHEQVPGREETGDVF